MQATETSSPDTATSRLGGLSAVTAIREFLTFKLGAEEYGMDILRVRETPPMKNPLASPTQSRSSKA